MPPSLTQKLSPIDHYLKWKNQFSPRKSHWESKALLSLGSMLNRMANEKRALWRLGKFHCLEMIISSQGVVVVFKSLQAFCVYLMVSGLVFQGFLCVQMCVSASIFISCVFSLALSLLLVFHPIPTCLLLFYLILLYYYSFHVSLFSKERQIWVWIQMVGYVGRDWEEELARAQ